MNKKYTLLLILAVILVVIFWSSSLLQEYSYMAVDFLRENGNSHPYLGLLLFVLLSALSAMFFGFSSIWLVPVAVVLWSNPLTVVLLLFSWLIGAVASYYIGKFGGYPIVRKFISRKQWESYEQLTKNSFSFWVIFLFRFSLPSEIPGYLLGIAKYPFGKYMLVTFLAELPYAVYSVYAIDSIIAKDKIIFIFTIFSWFALGTVVAYLYKHKVKGRSL